MSGDISWFEDAPLHDIITVNDTGVPANINAGWFAEMIALGIATVQTDHAPEGHDP